MNTKEVIQFFGGVNATARALGIKPPSVSGWGETVPVPRQGHVTLAMAAEQKRRDDLAKKEARKAARRKVA